MALMMKDTSKTTICFLIRNKHIIYTFIFRNLPSRNNWYSLEVIVDLPYYYPKQYIRLNTSGFKNYSHNYDIPFFSILCGFMMTEGVFATDHNKLSELVIQLYKHRMGNPMFNNIEVPNIDDLFLDIIDTNYIEDESLFVYSRSSNYEIKIEGENYVVKSVN